MKTNRRLEKLVIAAAAIVILGGCAAGKTSEDDGKDKFKDILKGEVIACESDDECVMTTVGCCDSLSVASVNAGYLGYLSQYDNEQCSSEGMACIIALPEDEIPVCVNKVCELHKLPCAGEEDVKQINFTDQSSFDDWKQNAYDLVESKIEGDVLTLKISYSGGCKEHEFELVLSDTFMESDPVQVAAILSHEAVGDACEALINKELKFDLSELKLAYQEKYLVGLGKIVIKFPKSEMIYDFSEMSDRGAERIGYLDDATYSGWIVIKFSEGLDVEYQDGQFVSKSGVDFSAINRLLKPYEVQKLFSTSLEQKSVGQQKREEMPDLNLYYQAFIEDSKTAWDAALRIDAMPFIEEACMEAIVVNADDVESK